MLWYRPHIFSQQDGKNIAVKMDIIYEHMKKSTMSKPVLLVKRFFHMKFIPNHISKNDAHTVFARYGHNFFLYAAVTTIATKIMSKIHFSPLKFWLEYVRDKCHTIEQQINNGTQCCMHLQGEKFVHCCLWVLFCFVVAVIMAHINFRLICAYCLMSNALVCVLVYCANVGKVMYLCGYQ